ncbi:MAG: hypothetical protein ACK559_27610, partial [bacterium]
AVGPAQAVLRLEQQHQLGRVDRCVGLDLQEALAVGLDHRPQRHAVERRIADQPEARIARRGREPHRGRVRPREFDHRAKRLAAQRLRRQRAERRGPDGAARRVRARPRCPGRITGGGGTRCHGVGRGCRGRRRRPAQPGHRLDAPAVDPVRRLGRVEPQAVGPAQAVLRLEQQHQLGRVDRCVGLDLQEALAVGLDHR